MVWSYIISDLCENLRKHVDPKAGYVVIIHLQWDFLFFFFLLIVAKDAAVQKFHKPSLNFVMREIWRPNTYINYHNLNTTNIEIDS